MNTQLVAKSTENEATRNCVVTSFSVLSRNAQKRFLYY
jgi:hypothetical protein